MDTQIVYLPFGHQCKIYAFAEASDWQKITVVDLETKATLIDGWEAKTETASLPAVTVETKKGGGGQLGYRIQVQIQSARKEQKGPPWLPSTVALFSGGRAAWTYCTVGSEDSESTDKDWNDASVAFVFENKLFDPIYTLAPWVAEGIRNTLLKTSP